MTQINLGYPKTLLNLIYFAPEVYPVTALGKIPEKMFCRNHYCSIIAAITLF
jgi:hypothetical protein